MKSSFIKLSLIAASLASVFMLASCNKPEKEETGNPELTITSPEADTLNVAIAGGPCEITYTLKNPVEGVSMQVTAAEGIDWITDIDLATEGKITFNVASNEGQQPRETTLTIQYDFIKETVVVAQEGFESAYDHEFQATVFTGYYYGEETEKGVANYYFFLSDKEFVNDWMSPEGTYYLVDLYAALPQDPASITLPEGTFTFDLENTLKEGTFSTLSHRKILDFSGMATSADYEEGTIVISKDGENYNIELIVTIEGETWHVTYSGTATFEDKTSGDVWERPDTDYDAITEDITFVPESIDARFFDSEDGDNLQIEFYAGDTTLYCSFCTDTTYTGGTIKPGRYLVRGTYETETLVWGYASSFSMFGFSPLGTYVQIGEVSLFGGEAYYGLASGGYIEVVMNDDNTYHLDFNLELEGQYKLTGTYDGPVELVE